VARAIWLQGFRRHGGRASAIQDYYEFSRGFQLLIGCFILFLPHPLEILGIDIHSIFLEKIVSQNEPLFSHIPLMELTVCFKSHYQFSWDIVPVFVCG
jgi:hypothetical protein